jgi:hypothetical protein
MDGLAPVVEGVTVVQLHVHLHMLQGRDVRVGETRHDLLVEGAFRGGDDRCSPLTFDEAPGPLTNTDDHNLRHCRLPFVVL